MLLIFTFAALVFFHKFLDRACAAMIESIFGAFGILAGALATALRSTIVWLRRSPADEPGRVVVAAALAAGAVAVARADYRVLAQSFAMILPTESGAANLVAFSMVAVTVGAGVLAHCVRRPAQAAGCVTLACLLVGTQAVTAFTRTRQLDEARAVVDVSAPAESGTLVIAGQSPPESPAAPAPEKTLVDGFGPVVSAVVAGLLGVAQLVLAWGVVTLGGTALAWLAASPPLLLLAVPWLLLRAALGPEVRAGALAVASSFFGIFGAVGAAVLRLAPSTVTAEAHDFRLRRRRRATEAELEDLEHAAAAGMRGEAEAAIRAWKARKLAAIKRLRDAPPTVLALACADKLDNLRSIRQDRELLGNRVWIRLGRSKESQAWYYGSLARVFAGRAGVPGAAGRLFGEFVSEVGFVFGRSSLEP